MDLPKSVEVKTVAVLPELSQEFESVPFSLNFILKCYLRVLARRDHATFNGEDPVEAAGILFGFMKAFRNFKKSQLAGVDQIETFDFVGEQALRITFPQDLRDAVSDCFRGGDGQIKKFVELIEAYREFWGNGQRQTQNDNGAMPEFLEKIISKTMEEK